MHVFMNRLFLLVIALVIASSATSFVSAQARQMEMMIGPQSPPVKECPSISLTGPREPIFDGEIIGFLVRLDGSDEKLVPIYGWSISAGTIVGGFGTHHRAIDTTGVASERGITVTVQVAGLPTTCESGASIFLSVR